MAVDFAMLATVDEIVNTGNIQVYYWRVPFAGKPHIIASAGEAKNSAHLADGHTQAKLL